MAFNLLVYGLAERKTQIREEVKQGLRVLHANLQELQMSGIADVGLIGSISNAIEAENVPEGPQLGALLNREDLL